MICNQSSNYTAEGWMTWMLVFEPARYREKMMPLAPVGDFTTEEAEASIDRLLAGSQKVYAAYNHKEGCDCHMCTRAAQFTTRMHMVRRARQSDDDEAKQRAANKRLLEVVRHRPHEYAHVGDGLALCYLLKE